MFKSTRKKIVAAIMTVLAFLFLGTLAVIYVTSYIEVSNTNFEMLEHHADIYLLPENIDGSHFLNTPPDIFEPVNPAKKPFENDPSFQLSTFYTVAISDNGEILATDMGDRKIYDEETLELYAKDILRSNNIKGTKGSLVYFVSKKNTYTLVAFMDNTVIYESMNTLFRYTLIFGSVVLVVLFFIAVHIAKKIINPLEESYNKQKQFISDAGHELKTPISVINANSDLLLREIGENQWLLNIQYENERMGNLVIQLLELARTENVKPQKNRINFSRLVAGDVLTFEGIAYEKGLALNTCIADNIELIGNAEQLSQLISILVDNAINHGQNGKEIKVTLSEQKNSVVLSVVNSGEVIPDHKISQLFERFYRVDEARNGDNKHYGLGLSIAKAIVEAHGGKIDVICYNGFVEFKVTFSKTQIKN